MALIFTHHAKKLVLLACYCSSRTNSALQVSSKLNAPPFEEQQSLPRTKPKPQLAVILLLGLDGSGKTTLLGTLQGERNPRVRPSVGFKPVTMMLSEELKVQHGFEH